MSIPQTALTGIRLLIFDLDGTLVDSKKDLAQSVNAMREKMGLGLLPQEVVASYVGQGVTVLIRRALGEKATEENVEKGLAFFLDYYRLHMLANTTIYPGGSEALEALRDRKLAVLTNKRVHFSRDIFDRLGIPHYFFFNFSGNN